MTRSTLLAAFLFVFLSSPVFADELAIGGADDPDATASMYFVPKLVSAWYLEGAFAGGGSLTQIEPTLFGFYSAVGYKRFVADRASAFWKVGAYGYGLTDTVLGNRQGYGLELGLAGRLMSEDWFFGGLGLNLNLGLILQDRQQVDRLPETDAGFQAGLGLDTSFGTLFVLDPYLFAEFGSNFTVQSNWIGGEQHFSALARMFIRFDWAQRDSEWYREASPEPWE